MPPLLEAAEFLPADLPLVANFACGETEWGKAMADWIKAPQTARFGNSCHDTTIWLYYHPDGRIVGFGSLGTTRWRNPYPAGPYEEFSIIPALAIQTPFQHLPPDNFGGNVPFSHQILSDLIGRAVLNTPDFVVLYVHTQNIPAITLYGHFGFKKVPGERDGYIRMQRRLK